MANPSNESTENSAADGSQGENSSSGAGNSAPQPPAPEESAPKSDESPPKKDFLADKKPVKGAGRNPALQKSTAIKRKVGGPTSDNRPIFSPLGVQEPIENREGPTASQANKPMFKRSRYHRSVNLRFLTAMIAIFIVASGSTWGLHAFQVNRLASSLLDQQRRAQKSGDQKLASRYLSQYLGYAPDDVERHAELAELLLATATTPRERFKAMQYMEKVIRMDPLQNKIRRLLVDELIAFGRYPDALVHLESLLAQSPNEGELEYKVGVCHHAQEKFQKASIAYRNAIQHAPAQLEAYQHLAAILRERSSGQKNDEARKLIDSMVSANPHLAGAFAGRARFLLDEKDYVKAAADVSVAHKIDPKDLEILGLALMLIEKGIEMPDLSPADVRSQLVRLVKETPQEAKLYQALARLAEIDRKPDEALNWLTDGLKANPDNSDISVQVAEIWVRQGKFEEARQRVDQLKKDPLTEKVAAYLEASLLLHQQDWLTARAGFENLLKRIPGDSPLAIQTHLSLSQCARALRDPDAEIAAYRYVLEYRPDLKEVQQLLAQAMITAGQRSEAITYYESEVDAPEKPLIMARVMIQKMMSLPPDQRRWNEVEAALKSAEQSLPEQAEVPVLQAQVYELQGKPAEAREVLESTKTKFPDQVAPWVASIELEARLEDWDAAKQVLAAAREKLGNRPSLRLTELSLLLATDRDAVKPALETLHRELSQYTKPEQSQLLARMAAIYQSLGEPDQALSLFEEIISRNPQNLNAHLAFLEIAIQMEDIPAAQRELDRLKLLEGEAGPHLRLGRAAITAIRVLHKELPVENLTSVRDELGQLKKDRPNWPQIWLLEARIDELVKDAPAATKAYRAALERGSEQPSTVGRLIQLLVMQQEFSEADSLIRRYFSHADWTRTSTIYQLASEVAFRMNDKPRALEYARQSAKLKPDDSRSQMWLARLLGNEGQSGSELEVTLRKAIDTDRDNPEPWLALIQHLAGTNRMLEAQELLEEGSQAVDENKASIYLASGYEILKQPAEAEQHYLAALSLQSDDPNTIAMVADFYARTNALDKAEPLLARLLKPDLKVNPVMLADSRRKLAAIWAQRDYAGLKQGLTLLNDNADDGKLSRTDQLLTARLLSQYPRTENRQEALRIYRELETAEPLSPEDEMRLAKLLVGPEAQPEADRRWQKLATEYPNREQVLIGAVGHFMRRQRQEDAGQIISMLNEAAPLAASTAELSAEHAVRGGDVPQALTIYQTYVDGAPSEEQKPARRMQVAAMAFRLVQPGLQIALDPAGEKRLLDLSLSNFEAVSAQFPEAKIGIANLLVHRKDYDAAIDRFEELLVGTTDQTTLTRLMSLYKSASLSDAQRTRIDNLLDSYFAARDVPTLRWQLAAWHDQRGNHEKSAEIYRELLAENDNNIIILNNLAWSLAFDPAHLEESRGYIVKALQIAGPIPDILDTRGVILILAGEHQQAVQALQLAIEEGDTAVRRFHLAWAFAEAKDLDAARFHWKEAQRQGLTEQALDPREVPRYQTLQKELVP
ncbi:MAG: tetratricopeptide repeat protein [Planctomycetaceae bacterium]